MSTALERCSRESITINTDLGPLSVKAWRLGGFACHRGLAKYDGRWVVTHLATGLQLSSRGTFDSEDEAAEAMEQIAAEGDWSDLSEAGRKKLGRIVERVFKANGARR